MNLFSQGSLPPCLAPPTLSFTQELIDFIPIFLCKIEQTISVQSIYLQLMENVLCRSLSFVLKHTQNQHVDSHEPHFAAFIKKTSPISPGDRKQRGTKHIAVFLLQVIHLWFEDFDLEETQLCTRDFITLQDSLGIIGKSGIKSDLAGKGSSADIQLL